MRFKLLVLMVCFQFSANKARAEMSAENQEAIESLNAISTQLKNNFSNPACPLDTKFSEGESCNFVRVCEKLRANRNNKNLYTNADGKSFPNLKLMSAQKAVESCNDILSNKSEESEKVMQQAFNNNMRKTLEKRKEFLNSIEKNKEEQKLVKLEQAVLDNTINAQSNTTPYYVGASLQTRAEIEKSIYEIEKKAGIALSSESRDKWIEWMVECNTFSVPEKQGESLVTDPFLNTELLTNPKLAGGKDKVLAHQAAFQKEVDKSFSIFKDTKSEIIKILEKKKNGKNNEQLDSMIKKISTIKMTMPPSLDPMMLDASTCRSPNAYYNPINHEFTLCPSILKLPDATLQLIISHELAHSIDPCDTNFPLTEVSGTKKVNPITETSSEMFKKSMEIQGQIPFEPKIPKQSPEVYSAFEPGISELSLRNEYSNLKLIPRAKGFSFNENPFASAIECLQTTQSVNARIGNSALLKKGILTKIENLKKSGAAKDSVEIKQYERALGQVDSEWSSYKACSFMSSENGHSQMQEAFSDWIAAKVTEEKIKAAPSDKEASKIAFESNGFFASLGCHSFEPDIYEKIRLIKESSVCKDNSFMKTFSMFQPHDDPHPESHARIDRIFMASPVVAKALKCSPEPGVVFCE